MKGNKNKVEAIVKDLKFVLKHTEEIKSLEDLENNEVLLNCILFKIIQISENANKITNDFKEDFNIIPWSEIKGLRNRVVHDYGNVNLLIIYKVLKIYFPEVLEKFETLLVEQFDKVI